METLELTFAEPHPRVCRVRAGPGALDRLVADAIEEPPGRPLVVVSDATVGPLHARPLVRRLRDGGLRVERLEFPAGEASKTRESKHVLEDRLLAIGAGREAALIGLGGGVTGDLAGFLAATWHRGIPFLQAPTSLLAMVDAALGGKAAVNVAGHKNLVGAFWQPQAVYADVSTLSTLPDTELRNGFAEAIKTAVVADAELFRRLETDRDALLARDAAALTAVVGACLRAKARIVTADERDRGRRAILNFGHTVAHALEAAAPGALPHGRAVAIGVALEGRLAVERAGFPPRDLERLLRLLEAFGLPHRPPSDLDVDAVRAAARKDKKNRGGRILCALPAALGGAPHDAPVTVAIDEPRLARLLSN